MKITWTPFTLKVSKSLQQTSCYVSVKLGKYWWIVMLVIETDGPITWGDCRLSPRWWKWLSTITFVFNVTISITEATDVIVNLHCDGGSDSVRCQGDRAHRWPLQSCDWSDGHLQVTEVETKDELRWVVNCSSPTHFSQIFLMSARIPAIVFSHLYTHFFLFTLQVRIFWPRVQITLKIGCHLSAHVKVENHKSQFHPWWLANGSDRKPLHQSLRWWTTVNSIP